MGFKPNEREYRSIIEINAIENDDEKKEKRVSGYACTFNQQYTLMEFDDEEFMTTQERLNMLNHLKLKYGGSIEKVMLYQQQLADKIEKLQNADAYKS